MAPLGVRNRPAEIRHEVAGVSRSGTKFAPFWRANCSCGHVGRPGLLISCALRLLERHVEIAQLLQLEAAAHQNAMERRGEIELVEIGGAFRPSPRAVA